ncbi:FlgD immunoglobulin-like domain containing protein [Candidatus Cloacimonadota bacterium]
MYETYDYVVPLIWEGDGLHPSPMYLEREDLYEVFGLPHAQFQGVNSVIGGGGNMLPYYSSQYNNFVNNESPFEMDLSINVIDNNLELVADVLVTGNVNPDDQNKILLLVTYNFSYDYSCSVQRYAEFDFNLVNIGSTDSFSASFDIDPDWVLGNVRGAAVIQKMDGTPGNYPIHQAAIVEYPLTVPNPIANQTMNLNETNYLDMTDFFYFQGNPVNADITVQSSEPDIVQTNLNGMFLELTSFGQEGSAQIDITGEYQGYYSFSSFSLYVMEAGFHSIIIVDLDTTPTGSQLQSSLQNYYDRGEVYLTNDIEEYAFSSNTDAVFVLLGIYPNNHELSSAEGTLLASYISNGGNVYLEGGDTWYGDPQTPAHSYFHINALNNQNFAIYTIYGHDFLDGFYWSYSGEASFIDALVPITPAVTIFSNPAYQYDCGIAYDAGNYKTIGTSFEITGLGGASSLDDAVSAIVDFFEIDGPLLLPPVNLQVDNISGLFTWEVPPTEEIIGYDLFLDGELQGNTTELEWQFTGLENGMLYEAGVIAVYETGTSNMSSIDFIYEGTESGNIIVSSTRLIGNFPNPFNPETTISFSTTENTESTEIVIFNLKGQRVKTLLNQVLPAGHHSAIWNGTDDSGKPVSSGVYFYKLRTGDFEQSKKMLMMK